MTKKIIGIPSAFSYYRYHILWETFFKELGCKVLTTKETTKETIEVGKTYEIDESCLPAKIYMGHVASLRDKCDYILIPRIENYGKNEKVCVKFNATYDLVNNLFADYQILDYNIERNKFKFESIGLIKIGLKLNKNIFKVLKSYYLAKKAEKKYNLEKTLQQKKILGSTKPKVLIVSHDYNIYDNFIGTPVVKKLEKLGVDIIYADALERKTAKIHAINLSPTLYWTYSKELIGAINYYREVVDGILFLTTFPCGPDSLVNELMLRKITNIPVTNILIDELTSDTGLDTRLESFVDIIKERKNKDE